jgi:recombination protein RecA
MEKDKTKAGEDKARKAALDSALKKIEKDFGKGAIMRLGDAQKNLDIEVIPTGILPLDIALGVGGIPRGRIIEIYGPESSGKTTVTLHMIAAGAEGRRRRRLHRRGARARPRLCEEARRQYR